MDAQRNAKGTLGFSGRALFLLDRDDSDFVDHCALGESERRASRNAIADRLDDSGVLLFRVRTDLLGGVRRESPSRTARLVPRMEECRMSFLSESYAELPGCLRERVRHLASQWAEVREDIQLWQINRHAAASEPRLASPRSSLNPEFCQGEMSPEERRLAKRRERAARKRKADTDALATSMSELLK